MFTVNIYVKSNPQRFIAFQEQYCISRPQEESVKPEGGIVLAYDKDWPIGEPHENKVIVSFYVSAPEIIPNTQTNNFVKFQGLVREWQNERGARSSITEAAMMSSYQKIIGMGDDAIPLIIAQLKSEGDEPDQWFWALKAITGVNPVKPEDQGDFYKMAQAWIRWAEEGALCSVVGRHTSFQI